MNVNAVRACRVIQNLEHLQHHNPGSNIIVLAILPRGSNGPDTRAFTLPSEFSPGIAEVNKRLDTYTQSHNKLHFADCSKPFITDSEVCTFPAVNPSSIKFEVHMAGCHASLVISILGNTIVMNLPLPFPLFPKKPLSALCQTLLP